MEPVRPDYDGAWIGAVVPSLLAGEPAPGMPEPATRARRVVLLVLDGLGWSMLQAHREKLPTLAALEGGVVTSVVPSTTAAGLTSITTGATPGEHGLVGYRIGIGGAVLNVLKWRSDGDKKSVPDPVETQPVPPFLGKPVQVVSRGEFDETKFTTAHLRGSQLWGWRTTAVLVEHVRRRVADGEAFVHVYYDGIDKVAHEFGLRDGFLDAELAFVDRLVAELLDALDGDTALVVTADHGQVHVGSEGVHTLGDLDPLISAYAGESRFRSLYARSGAAAELADAARERYGDLAWVFTRDELFDDGWFGPAPRDVVRSRIGDVVLAAREAAAFADPNSKREAKLVGCHGSVTADEMYVPLLAGLGSG
jgi:hypothetical protein